jgi:ATP-binding cassette, subfamily B, bacterial MsbA
MADPAPHNRSSHLARLWGKYLRPHAGKMALAFGLMVIEGATLGALSYLLEPLFDRVFAKGGQDALIWVGLGILGLFVIRACTLVASRTLMTTVSQTASTTMQGDLLEHLLTLDSRFFQTNPPGALIERVQGDTLAVQGVWTALLTGVGRDSIALLSLFAVAVSIDWRWTLAALIGAPLLLIPALALQRYIRRKTTQMRNSAGQRATRLDEIFHGIQAVKLNRMEAYQTGRFRQIVAQIARSEVKMATGRSMMPALIDVVTGIGFFAVLMLGGREVAAGERTTGEFMAFFTAMALTFQPLRRLGDLAGVWQIAAASLDRIYALFDLNSARVEGGVAASHLRQTPPEIRFEDVSFDYDGTPVLRELSFTARAGQMTALVGASGAGKSTVFHLLTGLEQATAGRITLDGHDVRAIPLPDLRAMIAVVSQDTGLFDETIRENVVLGQDVDQSVLEAALSAAHVSEFAGGLPRGIDTAAGPRGSALSGGQRQRVAIARAVLRDAPVLLLDEATSALDAESEALVSGALTTLGKGRTTLVIAHRLATIRAADHIIVLDQGRVVETGRHDDLMAKGGRYADLQRMQMQAQ